MGMHSIAYCLLPIACPFSRPRRRQEPWWFAPNERLELTKLARVDEVLRSDSHLGASNKIKHCRRIATRYDKLAANAQKDTCPSKMQAAAIDWCRSAFLEERDNIAF
jgi:transposase